MQWTLTLAALLLTVGTVRAEESYEIGGPLAGVKLPLFAPQHGEPAGYPGCTRDAQGRFTRSPQGQYPELELYPGAEEHWRPYWFHYMPIRSFFDRQSQLMNFTAPDIPGAPAGQIEQYAAPVAWVPSHGMHAYTGDQRQPVPVVRCGVGGPTLKLDLGPLPSGLYVVRLIAAAESAQCRPFLQPLYVRMRVNDGLDGSTNSYRRRIGYVDEFYSLAEMYFHAPEPRRYTVEIAVDQGSQVDLLVHNVSIDDALAGCQMRVIKPRQVKDATGIRDVHSEKYVGPRPTLSADQRLARDAAIWQAYPPINANSNDAWAMTYIKQGAQGQPQADLDKEYGAWQHVSLFAGGTGREMAANFLAKAPPSLHLLARNDKLQLNYSMADLAQERPLPDPYPIKDTGAGLYYPDAADPNAGLAFVPLSMAVMQRIFDYCRLIDSGSWMAVGGASNDEFARDSAIALVRFAYDYPTLDTNNSIGMIAHDPGPANRPIFRRRNTISRSYGAYINYLGPVEAYDRLYDYIRGNEELAKSINRFIPWVHTSQDVLALLDTYLVQTVAKRMMRYHYYGDGREPEFMAQLAILVANPQFTEPWMDWMFTRDFLYPNPPAGIQDIAISGTDREGRSTIGSFSYMIGEFASFKIAEELSHYIEQGGDSRFDLRDFGRFPKTLSSLSFEARCRIAGGWFPAFGSSSGPDKPRGAGFFPEHALLAWRWSRDPNAAYTVQHYVGRTDQTDAQWREIEAAARQVRRPQWMEQPSRFIGTVGGILETGREHDDFRFRRSVVVRTAATAGHNHSDTLDLQVYAHGLPMTCDSGQRHDTVYSRPRDTVSAIHNTVVVNGQDFMGYAWPRAISDGAGARYLCAQALPPGMGIELLRRQVALIDVDEGRGSVTPLKPEQLHPTPTAMPRDVVTANSYVFDVFRAAGANDHTYCFHATVGDFDGPQPTITLPGLKQPEQAKTPEEQLAAKWLDDYFGQKVFAKITGDFSVTFPLLKERNPPKGKPACGTESYWLREAYDPSLPDKFTRLHVFGAEGAMFMKGDQHCMHYEYTIPQVFIRRCPAGTQSAFVTVIEPYAGQPFITAQRSLDIADNEADALRAVAVELTLADGRKDICFADGRPERTRTLRNGAGKVQIAGEFGYLSTDAKGVRQATLTGGSLLDTPQVYLQPATAQWSATITKVDYLQKTAWVDQRWPARIGPLLLEVGTLPESGQVGYVTSMTAARIERHAGGAAVTFQEGGDLSRGPVTRVIPEANQVASNAALPVSVGKQRKRFAASNDQMNRFWHADVLGGDDLSNSTLFQLSDAPVSATDFETTPALRLWEYGPGDTLRRSTLANLRRLDSGVYQLESDSACIVGLPANKLEVSTDGENFTALAGKQRGSLLLVEVDEALLGADGKVWLRP